MKLFEDVKAWSEEVFGSEPAIWRCLGIVEELGELVDAETEEDRIDALADAGIFTFDLAARSGIEADELLLDEPMELDASIGRSHLQSAIGSVAQVLLKTAQGIRGMDNEAAAREALVKALVVFFETLKAYTVYNYKKDLIVLIGATYDRIVSKRTKVSLTSEKEKLETKTLESKSPTPTSQRL